MKFGNSILCRFLVVWLFIIVVENNILISQLDNSLSKVELKEIDIECEETESVDEIEYCSELICFFKTSNDSKKDIGATLNRSSLYRNSQDFIQNISPPPEV